jgi:hypothetical protein
VKSGSCLGEEGGGEERPAYLADAEPLLEVGHVHLHDEHVTGHEGLPPLHSMNRRHRRYSLRATERLRARGVNAQKGRIHEVVAPVACSSHSRCVPSLAPPLPSRPPLGWVAKACAPRGRWPAAQQRSSRLLALPLKTPPRGLCGLRPIRGVAVSLLVSSSLLLVSSSLASSIARQRQS